MTASTAQLAALINQKQDVLKQLRQVSRHQLDLIETSDMDRLIRALATKQKLLTELQRIETDLDPFRDDDPDQRVWVSAEARRLCRQTADRCASVLQEVMLLEKHGQTALQERRDRVVSRLDGIQHGAAANRAYSNVSRRRHGRLDLSSE